MRREGALFSDAFADVYVQAMILPTWVQWRSDNENPSLAQGMVLAMIVLSWRSMGAFSNEDCSCPGNEMTCCS
jgi:hypothetical protein